MIVTFEDAQSTILKIQEFDGPATDFRLLVPDAMNDAAGINLGIVTDAILARNWWPDGFEQNDGYRIYAYSGS